MPRSTCITEKRGQRLIRCMCADRQRAPAPELRQKCTLDNHGPAGGWMVDGSEDVDELVIVVAALDRPASLPRAWHEGVERKVIGDLVEQPEHVERGSRHHDRPTFRDL